MYESIIHCLNPTNKAVVIINIVSVNKQGFSKRNIISADQANNLYSKLGYPPVKYFRWITKIQQIIDCPVMVQDINILHAIRSKNIAA